MTYPKSDQENTPTSSRHCPFLGIAGDATTHYQYAAQFNCCHIPARPDPVQLDHQQAYCLTDQHSACPVYRGAGLSSLPAEIRGDDLAAPAFWNRTTITMLIGLLVLALVSVLVFVILPQMGQNAPVLPPALNPTRTHPSLAPTDTPTPVLLFDPSAPLPTATPTVTPSPTPSPTPTLTPTATFTPTYFPSPGPEFGTPFGDNPAFVIHLVGPGQSFTAIADLYHTSPEVLAAINPVRQGQTLWVDRPIVVAVGVTDPTGLPQFDVYQPPLDTTLEAVAAQFNVAPDLLRRYNVLSDTIPEIPAGRWLIIPLPQAQ
jgi:LysM repeat protein